MYANSPRTAALMIRTLRVIHEEYRACCSTVRVCMLVQLRPAAAPPTCIRDGLHYCVEQCDRRHVLSICTSISSYCTTAKEGMDGTCGVSPHSIPHQSTFARSEKSCGVRLGVGRESGGNRGSCGFWARQTADSVVSELICYATSSKDLLSMLQSHPCCWKNNVQIRRPATSQH